MRTLVLLAAGLGFAATAFANNEFIPNFYRDRREANDYSATAWSTRKELALYNFNNSNQGTQGGQSNLNDSSTEYEGRIFYRATDNINIEATTAQEWGSSSFPLRNDHTDTYVTRRYLASFGYEFSDSPIALAASYVGTATDEAIGNGGPQSNSSEQDVSVAVGYRLPDQIYLGVGMTSGATTAYAVPNTNSETLSVGAGRVFGDPRNPTATAETHLKWFNNLNSVNYELAARGLLNQGGFQYYGEAAVFRLDGPGNGTGYDLSAGLDYQIDHFWVGPLVTYNPIHNLAANYSNSTIVNASIEGGYRDEHIELLAYLGSANALNDFPTSASYMNENTEVWGLGASYRF